MADRERDGADEARPDSDRSLGVAVLTVSATRTIETDEPGSAVVDALEEAGHAIEIRERIEPDFDAVQAAVSRLIDRDDVHVVVTVGATGVEPTDVTVEAVRPILGTDLPAFAQLFTLLAYERIGTRVVAGRTVAGVTDGVPVFCLPGNADATRLAVERIVVPEVDRLVAEAAGDGEREGDGDGDGDGTGDGEREGDGDGER